MTKELERDLGLWSVMAISVGAMVGSGIFILPALAMKMAGPAVVLAYLLAGVLVLPAALSKSEMATAMPEAGGTYIYIERSMGPLFGTVAGIGTWFALSFKGALALVGGAPYIVLLVAVRPDLVAVGAAVVLVAVNLVGVKQTGRMQIAIVVAMLAAMTWFVAGSGGDVAAANFEGFFAEGSGGVLGATAFVFVSYAGVTKIASVAEEIENPARNVPLGMLGSLGFTTALYVLVVVVLVGAAGGGDLAGSDTPVADVAATTLPEVGVVAIVAAAVLALVSTANAGLLSSSRYPFAMSRDDLAPAFFEHISPRFKTPTVAIGLTGAVVLAMVVFVPIDDIAKLGSAFKILVFVLINVAVVVFRESDVEGYDPAFRDPLYPWSQAVGVGGGLLLLTQIGLLPQAGTLLIVGVGLVWYLVYVRGRVDREGVARGELRRRVGERAIERTEVAFDGGEDETVLVAITDETGPEEGALVEVGAAVADERDGSLTVVRFDAVPDQLPLATARERRSTDDTAFEDRMAGRAADLDVPVEYGEIVSHDTAHAVVNFTRHSGAEMLVLGGGPVGGGPRLVRNDVDWIARQEPCDLLVVDAARAVAGDTVAVVTDQGPFDPLKARVADAVAAAAGADIELVPALGVEPTGSRSEAVDDYHEDLGDLFSVPVESTVTTDSDPAAVADVVAATGLVVVGREDSAVVRRLDDRDPTAIVDAAHAVECGTVVVYPDGTRRPNPLERLLERLAF
jgi:amino acid transporter